MTLRVQDFRKHVARVVSLFDYPFDQVNLDTLCPLWEPAITSGTGRAYANPSGFLLAWFIVDPISGEKTAAQQLWMQAQPGDGLALFRDFERDAKEWGAKRIVSGFMAVCDVPRMRKLYARLGYTPFSESFSKVL